MKMGAQQPSLAVRVPPDRDRACDPFSEPMIMLGNTIRCSPNWPVACVFYLCETSSLPGVLTIILSSMINDWSRRVALDPLVYGLIVPFFLFFFKKMRCGKIGSIATG